jgi:hypothetical protein
MPYINQILADIEVSQKEKRQAKIFCVVATIVFIAVCVWLFKHSLEVEAQLFYGIN